MDYTTLKNQVFENYYFNSFLPATIGGYASSAIFNYLLSIENLRKELKSESNVSKKWIDSNPTWYTSQLPNLFFIPKFNSESEQDYLDRLFLLVGINQDEGTIINAVFSLLRNAVIQKTDIQTIDKLEGVSAVWGDEIGAPPNDWDGTSVWTSEEQVTRTLFLVNIDFGYRGSNLDTTAWDYWILPENYTKIEDMVKLYKPPGSTFELRLTIPQDYEQTIEIFSNTLIA